MPDFSVVTSSNVSLAAWTDPPTDARPTRINAALGIQHLRYSSKFGVPITFDFATDAGSTTFAVTAWLAEAPGIFPWPSVGVSSAPTSVTFTPLRAGHHTLVVRHDLGGSVVIHIDIEQQ